MLGSDSSKSLEEPFLEGKVFDALSGLSEDRAPCLDGCVMTFW